MRTEAFGKYATSVSRGERIAGIGTARRRSKDGSYRVTSSGSLLQKGRRREVFQDVSRCRNEEGMRPNRVSMIIVSVSVEKVWGG